MDQPLYPHRPIRSVEALARALGVSSDRLNSIATRSDSFYHGQKKQKRDGGTRTVYSVDEPLKYVQGKILKQLLYRVQYPWFLQGGIRDRINPRSYVQDAELHLGAQLVLTLDVKDFFPSVSRAVVGQIWNEFFNFADPVASLLAQLTTYSGFLPQGAKTSSCLCNLVFWQLEPDLVAGLARRELMYSRYIDDITVSSRVRLPMHELQPVVRSLIDMLAQRGLKPKRRKLVVLTPSRTLTVHGIIVSGESLNLSRRDLSEIRSSVHKCSERHQNEHGAADYLREWRSARGKVERLRGFRPLKAQAYLAHLEAVRPDTDGCA